MAITDVPAKVLECFVRDQIGIESWPFDDQTGDPFWTFGSTPRDYRWKLTIEVKPQHHSSHKTRLPRIYTGMDVQVGDYIATTVDGTALRIISIAAKTDDVIECVVEDVFRYNTFRDTAGVGSGLFAVPAEAMIFETNDQYLPVVDPLPPGGVGPSFYPNLMSRFQNLERVSNFTIHQPHHGFSVGQLVSADRNSNSFTLTDDEHPYLIGTVSYVLSRDDFTVDPIQSIVDDLDYLPGRVADILYADPDNAGSLTAIEGTNPVMIKLREFTQTVVSGTVSDASTASSSVLGLNGSDITVGSGSLDDVIIAINMQSSHHGVVARVAPSLTVMETTATFLNSHFGEVLIEHTNTAFSARINGVLVVFTSTDFGSHRYEHDFSALEDIISDINAADIPGTRASQSGNRLVLTNELGGGITIENVEADRVGHFFAGEDSVTGLPLTAVANPGRYLRLEAQDARPINIVNRQGSPLQDFGITSVENGIKAAGIYVEQGIRTASNYVVADMAARSVLDAIIGDQAYVIDKGDGEWGLYLFTGSTWKVISTAEAAKVDSDTYTAILTPLTPVVELGRVNGGSKVTSVTMKVTEAFDASSAISVGDPVFPARLASNDDVDLQTVGSYVVNPTQIYQGDQDHLISVYISSTGAVGSVEVTVTYQ